ncbi:zinc finger BED domain-containing protein 5-like [Aplysia californica]|uniref:Zinc finger BED domain-containing protein 5-like n=1 Tax=Aplysia californica TaxID=6500 RepID=A0ABM1A1V9_APLCA|nr:zinc finger BED domain-containing protein 5-like [Aplysia californica]
MLETDTKDEFIFKEVQEFFEEKQTPQTNIVACAINGAPSMTDLFTKFNQVNLQLQGDDTNLIKAKSMLSSFLSKLEMFHRNIGRREFAQFPSLTETLQEGRVSDEELEIYTNHLRDLHADIKTMFTDIF